MEKVITASPSYLSLIKPRIILGNVITTAGGFALALSGPFQFLIFLMTLVGIALVIASACIFNNYIDREYDKKMERTKNRPLASGQVSPSNALLVASLLGFFGAAVLGIYTNFVTMWLAIFGFVMYVLVYSFLKYQTSYGTLIGSIAGAIPPLVGYYAAKAQFDLGALLIFATVAFWQMPHFYAISIYRLEDYKSASIPVWPLVRGLNQTKIQMVLFVILFAVASSLLFFLGYANGIYLAISLVLSISWLTLAITGFTAKNDQLWARQMFVFSLVVIMGLCMIIPFGS